MGKIDLNLEETSIYLDYTTSQGSDLLPNYITINKPVSWLTKSSRADNYIFLLRGVYLLSYSQYAYGFPNVTYLDEDDKYHVFEAVTTNKAPDSYTTQKTMVTLKIFIINKDTHISWSAHPYDNGTMTFMRI